MIKVVPDFLDFPLAYYEACKTMKYYNQEDFKKLTGSSSWSAIRFPGLRTDYLNKTDPILFYAVLGYIKNKFELNLNKYKRIDGHAQVRFDNTDDWIHKDFSDTVIIYLSPTNVESGTGFFKIIGDDGRNFQYEKIGMTNFIHNTGIYFTEGTQHSAINNHGKDINDGRLTITYFLHNK